MGIRISRLDAPRVIGFRPERGVSHLSWSAGGMDQAFDDARRLVDLRHVHTGVLLDGAPLSHTGTKTLDQRVDSPRSLGGIRPAQDRGLHPALRCSESRGAARIRRHARREFFRRSAGLLGCRGRDPRPRVLPRVAAARIGSGQARRRAARGRAGESQGAASTTFPLQYPAGDLDADSPRPGGGGPDADGPVRLAAYLTSPHRGAGGAAPG